MHKPILSPTVFATAVVAVLVAASASADEAFESAMQKCAGIEDEDARLICFDALATLAPDATEKAQSVPEAPSQLSDMSGASEKASPAAAAAPVAPAALATDDGGRVPVAEDTAQPLTDDVGKERVDPTQRENPEYAARVVRCDRNRQSGQLYFFFDNDQVWKQANYRRMSLGDCQFEVRLSKDAFGYELYIPSKDRKVRVTRLR